MSMQELLQAFGMFKQSVQEAATTNAINDASQAMQQIKTGITDQAQQRQALQGLSDQLALRLTGVGAPASTIQTAFQAIHPQQFGSAEQMQLEGMLSGNKQYQDVAKKAMQQAQQSQFAKLGYEAGLKAQLQQQELMGKMQIEGLKASLQKKELKSEEVNKLSEAATGLDMLDKMEHAFNALDKSAWLPRTGPLAMGSNINPERAAFEQTVKQNFDAYRKAITGAGASEKELAMLEQSQPNISDNPWQFKAKLENSRNIMKGILARRTQEFKAAGRDVSGFEQMQQQQEQQQAVMQQRDAFLRRYEITGGGK